MWHHHHCCHNHHHFSILSLSLSHSRLSFSHSPKHPILVSISFPLLTRFSARLSVDSLESCSRHLHASSSFSLLLECERTSSPLYPDSFFFECFSYRYFSCLPPNRLIPVLEPFFRVLVVGISRVSFSWPRPITDDGSANPALNLIFFPLPHSFSSLSLVSPIPNTSIPSSLSFRIRRSSRPAGSRLVQLLCLPLQRLLRRILPRTTPSVTGIPILSPTNQPLHIRPLPLLPLLVWPPPRILTLSTLRRPPSLLLNPPKSLLRHPPRRRPWLRPRTA